MPVTLDADLGSGGALTAASVLDAVRRRLGDPSGVRWPQAVLVRYLNDAVRRLYQRRPAAFLQSGDVLGAVEELTVAVVRTGRALPVGVEWRPVLSAYVEGQCWLEDEEDARSAERGASAMQLWEQGLGGKG